MDNRPPSRSPSMPPSLPRLERDVHWYSRGYLPHCDAAGAVQMLTFRLANALPEHVVQRIREDPLCRTDQDRWERMQAYLDAEHGACYLREARVATLVENALLFFDAERHRLLAWSVMPSHVHTLIETREGHPLEEVTHSWKSYTGSEANKLLHRRGRFWQHECFDRYIRNMWHFQVAVEYIDGNTSLFSSARRIREGIDR